jgi:hypothetical protein
MGRDFPPFQHLLDGCWHALSSCLTHWTKPLRTSLLLATLTDFGKSKSQLIAENALRSWPGCTMTTERLPKEGQAESTR